MALRASSPDKTLNLNAAVGGAGDSGVPGGASLVAFAEAVLGDDDAALERTRADVLEGFGPDGLVDAAAIVATFQQMDRIADGTGIPLDAHAVQHSRGFWSELGLDRFASAANTPTI